LLALPPLLIAAGQYRVLLAAALTGTGTGLFAVHLAPSLAYVVIMLAGPMRSFDRRYATVARSLGAAPLRLWWQVKRPLLTAPLALAAAIGFAVSFGQFAAAQLAAAGRFSTLPMEAITLSSGGNRALIAATGLTLALPPLMAFLLASLLARSRWA
jgi:putative thiamine transport system permease protein